MAGRQSSSSRTLSSEPGDWEKCSVPHSRLVELQTQGLLPPAYMVPVRAGLATYNGGEQAENFPNPSRGERICLVPYLLRGLGFPIHPFLCGILEFYALQLHNFTPASINVILLGFSLSIMAISTCQVNTRSRGIFTFATLTL